MVPKLKYHQTYLKLCELTKLKVLNRNLTLVFKGLISKISSDLLENINTSQSEGAEYESDWF